MKSCNNCGKRKTSQKRKLDAETDFIHKKLRMTLDEGALNKSTSKQNEFDQFKDKFYNVIYRDVINALEVMHKRIEQLESTCDNLSKQNEYLYRKLH